MKLTHRILLIGCAATGLAALFYSCVATGLLPDAPYSRWVAIWTGSLVASGAGHSVWGRLISLVGAGNEVWISIAAGAVAVGIVTFQAMMLRLAFFFLDQTANEKQFNRRVYISGAVAFLVMLFAWPIAANSTRISFIMLDLVCVLAILTSIPVLRYKRRYSVLALAIIGACGTILGIEHPSPTTLLPSLAIVALAIFLSTWASWAYVQFVALEHIEEEDTLRFSVFVRSFFRKPYAYIAVATVSLAIFACAADCVWRLARHDGFLAERLAGCVLEDAKDAKWLVADPFLGDALARRIHLEGRKTPILLHTGCNYDYDYQTNLLAMVGSLGFGEKALLDLKVAAFLGVNAFVEELSLVEAETNRIAYVWTRELWPWERLTNVWESVKDDVALASRRDSFYVRRSFGRMAMSEAAAMQDAGRVDDAADVYLWTLRDVDPENASAVINLLELVRRGYGFDPETKEMIENFGQALFNERYHVDRLHELVRTGGVVYMPAEDRRRAFDRLRPQLEAYLKYRRSKDDAKHVLLNARLSDSISKNSKEEVKADAISVLRQDRDNVLGNGIMGTIAAFDGDYAVSELYLRRAVSSPAASAAAFNNYAEVLRRMGRFEEAEVNARKAVEIAPEFWRTHETLADVLLAKGASLKDVRYHLEKAEDILKVGREWKTVPPEAATLALIRLAVLSRDPSKAQERELLRRKIKRLELSDMQRRRVESFAPARKKRK